MNPAAYSAGSGAEILTAELFCYQFLIDVSFPLCESPVRPIPKATDMEIWKGHFLYPECAAAPLPGCAPLFRPDTHMDVLQVPRAHLSLLS